MTKESSCVGCPPRAVQEFLGSSGDDLREKRIDRLRLAPLILRAPLSTLITRRKGLFDFVQYDLKDYGVEVNFKRHIKQSKNHPEGRDCEGVFHLLTLSDDIMIATSTLAGDDHKQGPARFAEKAYPLALRPFVPSRTLVRLIEQFADRRGCTVTAFDTSAYSRQNQRLRRDFEPQAPAAAAREMAEQGRQIHRMVVRFQRRGRETARLSFDRNSAMMVRRGNPSDAVRELIMPALAEAMAADKTYNITRADNAINQEVVQLDFSDIRFKSYDDMRALCKAVRQGDGLNVAVIHLNPYLQAQILDFFTGAAIEMLVIDNNSVSLVPRSADCATAIQRVATTILDHFGEADVRRVPITEGS